MKKQEDQLFVTVVVRDRTGKKVATVKNARFEAGMARINQMIATKYRQEAPMPPLVRAIIEGK